MKSYLVEEGDKYINCEEVPSWLLGLCIEIGEDILPRKKGFEF